MLEWLKRDHPPANTELKNWKHTISNSGVKLVESETYPLSSFSQKLVCSYKSECPFNEQLKHIEINLGIQPNHYNHLFEVAVVHEKTSNYYNASELDALLKGEHAEHLDAFRALLADPIFDWQIKRNKEDFRQKVLRSKRIRGNGLPKSLWGHRKHAGLCPYF